ncbi:MAG TPA: type IX secretion system membrane protein PorP/SprF [Bacteroidia bacterium]|nr:type IX secretion system membrane protein PorP/SprF [Bacteroidia bacterium]
MKKIYFFLSISLLSLNGISQQLPNFTQFEANDLFFNPAVAGTKKLIDVRTDYRMQWLGFDGAPTTKTITLNSRFMNGKMGAGFCLYQDETGPTTRTTYLLDYAYHLKFNDAELSFGLDGSMTEYFVNGGLITIHNSMDPAINQAVTQKAWTPDAGAGLYLYNDRYHFGLSVLNLMQGTEKFTASDARLPFAPHIYGSLGYNFSANPDYIFEHTLFINYVAGSPFLVDYSLRMHYKEKMFIGLCYIMKDAISLQAGMTFKTDFQVSYSYDLVTSPLHLYNSGTHEIMLIYSTDLKKKKGTNSDFQKRKYGYLF